MYLWALLTSERVLSSRWMPRKKAQKAALWTRRNRALNALEALATLAKAEGKDPVPLLEGLLEELLMLVSTCRRACHAGSPGRGPAGASETRL